MYVILDMFQCGFTPIRPACATSPNSRPVAYFHRNRIGNDFSQYGRLRMDHLQNQIFHFCFSLLDGACTNHISLIRRFNNFGDCDFHAPDSDDFIAQYCNITRSYLRVIHIRLNESNQMLSKDHIPVYLFRFLFF